jgi:predicted RNA-binding Zn-ribbon protein involved in translation (DUF1610 family)
MNTKNNNIMKKLNSIVMRAVMADMVSKWRCPHCGTWNSDDSYSCRECGEDGDS